jgi:NADH/NAD ratio-sensing transcriptional regulator Rex
MASEHASEPSVLRLSRYHCFLGELMGVRSSRRVTSRELAEELGLSEETVRHDLKHVDVEGRPGAGYDMGQLYEALQEYLELSESHPIAIVGNADVLRGLLVTFPTRHYGLQPAAYLSERPEDFGVEIDGLKIQNIEQATEVLPALGVSVAMVACSPDAVDGVQDALIAAGVRGVLMLTPVLRPRHPEGMNVTYFRMPCALKALASALPAPEGSCCGGKAV